MATKYSKIAVGTIFEAKGGKFRKVDDLYYEDLNTGFQAVWNPVFDDTIASPGEPVPQVGDVNTKDKFLVDAQTRVLKPNPDYKDENTAATRAIAALYTGLGIGPENATFELVVAYCLDAVAFRGEVEGIMNIVNDDEKLLSVLRELRIGGADSAKTSAKKADIKKTPAKKTPRKSTTKPKKTSAKKPAKRNRYGK